MRKTALLPALLLAWTPLQAQKIHLPPGRELEARIDGDFNGDDVDDIAYLASDDDARWLTVLLS